MAHFFISAAHKSSGKTTVSVGLCAALARRSVNVAPFKKGPDYIDPLWLGMAAGRPCINLDFNTLSKDEILQRFARHALAADVALIEGNKGLYDGLDLHGSNSNAALATLLQAPVILVIDARGMTRGIAPLILGYQAFDNTLNIGGVILNNLGGSRHESKLRAVIEHYTTVPVLGAVHRNPALEITERHLGLIPSNEMAAARQRIDAIAAIIEAQVEMDKIQLLAAQAPLPHYRAPVPASAVAKPDIRLAIAKDAAFGFYYADDFDALRAAGAELHFIDTLHDKHWPDMDGLFIGGGFPETHMQALQANVELRTELRTAIEAGLPVYAECGGLMYLARTLRWHDRNAAMVGVIPGEIVMHDTPQGRGYIHLRETGAGPWPLLSGGGTQAEFHAHEFHYSSLENLPASVTYAYDVLRGNGVDGRHDGLVHKNVLAGFAHLRDARSNHWARRFVDFVRLRKQSAQSQLTVNRNGALA